jgi:hypothetical protein
MILKRLHLILTYLIFCFFVATPVLADQSSKRQKLFELMDLLGVQQVYKDQDRLCSKQAENFSPEVIYKQQPEYFGGIGPTDPLWSNIVASYEKYVDTYCSCISEKEFMELHAELYGEYVKEKELDVILKFLKSPIGQKDIHAGLMTRKRADEYISKKISEAEAKAYNDYMTEFERIISQHGKK